jgi:hypothetical protein
MLDREGAASPADISIIGNETEVVAGVEQLSNCGANQVAVSPFGSPEEVAATRAALGVLAAQADATAAPYLPIRVRRPRTERAHRT